MKAKRRKLLGLSQTKWRHIKPFVLGVIVAFVLASFCFATVISIPPTTKQVICGVWLGFTSEANVFYRLVLSEQGGMLGARSVGSRPRLYHINSWVLDSKGRMQLKISPASTNDYPIVLTGHASRHKLELKIESPDKGWREEVIVYREELIEKQMKDLKQAME